ncbi:hypothetical protein [Yoonia sp. 208BN28-4]|uniref:hypothetical protein n=1 Tax=Yoonia sp. 208BN28-4 TaxID=3126505 RepID=UPI0030AEF6A0
MTAYRYNQPDLMEKPERYFYTALQGPEFLDAYLADRADKIAALGAAEPASLKLGPDHSDDQMDTARLLDATPDDATLDKLVQRFEVTRKIYARYDTRLRKGFGPFDNLALYARLARFVAEKYDRDGSLRDLNALIKLTDLLTSQSPAAQASVGFDLAAALTSEMAAIRTLMRQKGLTDDH